jgi:hypothetical protein
MSDSTLGYPEPTGYDSDTPLNPQTMGEPRPLADFGAAPGGQAPASVTGGKMDARQRKTDLRMNKRITPTQGVTYSDDIGFNARSVIVDNDTGQWLFDSASRRYVPPGCFGAVLQFPSGSQIANVLWVAPPGVTQPTGIVGSTAILIYTEDLLDPSSGIIVGGVAGTGGTAGASVTTGAAAGGASLGAPPAADVLDGQAQRPSAGTTTILTVPAGRTWVGEVGLSLSASNEPVTATGLVTAEIATAGVGVTPPAGQNCAVSVALPSTVTGALSGVSGTAQNVMPLTVIAPAGNAVTITIVVPAVTGTISQFSAWGFATGLLQ